MKAKRTIVSAFAVLLAGSALLAGCGEAKPETGTNGGGQPAPGGGPVKLDIIGIGNGLPSPDQDIIKQELDKALGTDLNLTVYSSGDDYKNQINVRMASANFPDLFQVDRQQLKQFSEQGLLLDLAPYWNELKPVQEFIGEDSIKKGQWNGKQYAIAKTPQIPYNTYWIRKDWLDKLKLSVPETPEQLLLAAKAFTEQDPDGNGKKDTFGLTGGKTSAFNPIFGAYGVGWLGGAAFYVKDGRMVNSLYDEGMQDALGFIRQMIDAGVVDPELMANTGLQHQQKAIKGQAGIVYIDWPNMSKEQFVEQIKAVNPNAEWVQLAALKGPGGQFDSAHDIGSTAALYAMPKALEKSPDKLKKVIELLNYVSSQEGSNLVQFGIEGKHYNLDNGKVAPTELMSKEGGYFWLYQFTGRPELEYLEVKFAPQAEYMKFANDQPRIEALNGFIDFPDGFNAADANRYIEEELSKFMYGKRPLAEYDAFLNTLEGSMNYKAYLDAAEARLKELGYLK